MCLCIYTCVYIYSIHMICIYIYIERERDSPLAGAADDRLGLEVDLATTCLSYICF